MSDLLAQLGREPVFCVTSDQDWSPRWASQVLIEKFSTFGTPLHIFRTNPCEVLDTAFAQNKITQGWHPNFLKNSSHGDDAHAVVGWMKKHFPGCRTFRPHCLTIQPEGWSALAAESIVASSHRLTHFETGLRPERNAIGIVDLPIYFEDDVFFGDEPDGLDLARVKATLFTPGLKVLNFHATFVALNCPSPAYYQKVKAAHFAQTESPEKLRWPGRGTSNVVDELMALITSRYRCLSFVEIANAAARTTPR